MKVRRLQADSIEMQITTKFEPAMLKLVLYNTHSFDAKVKIL